MKIQEFGEQGSNTVLIQPVDDHDLAAIESEVAAIEKLSENAFHLISHSDDHRDAHRKRICQDRN